MTPTNLEELKRAAEALMQSRANGDPEKYAALLSVAEAHRIGRSVLSLLAENDRLRSELEAERERRESAEEALRPFAKAGELFTEPPGTVEFDQCIYNPAGGQEYALCGDHLRAARAHFQSQEASDDA